MSVFLKANFYKNKVNVGRKDYMLIGKEFDTSELFIRKGIGMGTDIYIMVSRDGLDMVFAKEDKTRNYYIKDAIIVAATPQDNGTPQEVSDFFGMIYPFDVPLD